MLGNSTDFKIDPRAHIGRVALKVADLARSEAFYTDVLGFTALTRSDGRLSLGVAGRPLLELEDQPGAVPKPRRSTGLFHFAILVPSRVALGRSLIQMAEKGYPLHGASDHLVSEALYLDDPDGNGIEIYRDRPRDQWKFEGGQVAMASDPVDLQALVREAGDEGFRGLDEETTIGHVHLQVRDLAEGEAFYCGVLGFEVMARWPGALFVAAGGYHHHIGLNTGAGVGAPPPPENAAGLNFFEIALPDQAAVDAMVERVGMAAGVVKDPSGNGIKLVVAA